MSTVDIGVDAARILQLPGLGQVRAVFSRALYLQVPGGLVVLASTRVPRGPLHLRVSALPAMTPGCPVSVVAGSLRIDDHAYSFELPAWSRPLPRASALPRTRDEAREWLPDLSPALGVGPSASAGLPGGALTALRRGDLCRFAALVGGRGTGLTPVGDDILAGVLLVARAIGTRPRTLRQCARQVTTNDIAREFLASASWGRCIEPAHDLLDGLANGDRRAVRTAIEELDRFGSSSGAALTYGIRAALLELPAAVDQRIVNSSVE
jgi:hypothetical protein